MLPPALTSASSRKGWVRHTDLINFCCGWAGVLAAMVAYQVFLPTSSAVAKKGAYSAKAVPPPQLPPRTHWGERLFSAGDFDNDGIKDLVVGVPFYAGGRIYATSGKGLAGGTARVLWVAHPPEPLGQFGFAISPTGDLDRDGIGDVAAGQGKVWLMSGKSGRLIRTLQDPEPQAAGRFGSRLGNAGDLTGDGVAEIVVGAPGKDVPAACTQQLARAADCRAGEGRAFLFNGADGALFRTLGLPPEDRPPGICASNCGSFGLSVQGPGDVDDDGAPDQLISAPSFDGGKGRLYLFSGQTGGLLRRIDSPEPQPGASFGFQDAAPESPGDVNGDGRADLYANGFLQNGPAGEGQGRAWILSGADGGLLTTLDDPTPTHGGQFGWSMTKTDHNGDGRPDVYVGSAPHHLPQQMQDGGTYVFEGQTGTLVESLELPRRFRQPAVGQNLGPNLGWSLAAPGDLDGDTTPDYVSGAPYLDGKNRPDAGALFVFLSQSRGPAETSDGSKALLTRRELSPWLLIVPGILICALTLFFWRRRASGAG